MVLGLKATPLQVAILKFFTKKFPPDIWGGRISQSAFFLFWLFFSSDFSASGGKKRQSEPVDE